VETTSTPDVATMRSKHEKTDRSSLLLQRSALGATS
jgi:hypothetical protein